MGKPTPSDDPSAIAEILDRSLTQAGQSLAEISAEGRVLLVFLRHAGCSFCRETLSDIARARTEIEQRGFRIILVHMGEARALSKILSKHQLYGLDLISDPEQLLYRLFGLKRGRFAQLFGWKVLTRMIAGGVLANHGVGPVRADASQLPGVFLIDRCVIVRRFRHDSAADRPDYLSLTEDQANAPD